MTERLQSKCYLGLDLGCLEGVSGGPEFGQQLHFLVREALQQPFAVVHGDVGGGGGGVLGRGSGGGRVERSRPDMS